MKQSMNWGLQTDYSKKCEVFIGIGMEKIIYLKKKKEKWEMKIEKECLGGKDTTDTEQNTIIKEEEQQASKSVHYITLN